MSQAKRRTTTLRNRWNGDVAFRVKPITPDCLNRQHRLNTYTVIWIRGGRGHLNGEFSCLSFESLDMLFFSPYQAFTLATDKPVKGTTYQFSNEFFCMEKHRKEIACDGVLFNNIYAPPCLSVDRNDAVSFEELTRQMLEALGSQHGFAREDILYSYLKIFLIHASRICLEQDANRQALQSEQPVLQKLKELIERHYHARHSPSDYAAMLHISPKALGKLTKKHFNRTPSALIADKLMVEARRQLYRTENPVKEIAFSLGFSDQHYFSRFFKKHAGIPADQYRRQVGNLASIFG